MQLCLDVDASINDEASQGERETQSHEWGSQSREIGNESKDKKHGGAGNVGCHGVQVGLDGAISEALHNDGQVKLHGLQRNTEADLNQENCPRGRVLENLGGLTQVELLANDGRRVHLQSIMRELLLFGCEKARGGTVEWQIPESKTSHNQSTGA